MTKKPGFLLHHINPHVFSTLEKAYPLFKVYGQTKVREALAKEAVQQKKS
jgi:hypothetical protein